MSSRHYRVSMFWQVRRAMSMKFYSLDYGVF